MTKALDATSLAALERALELNQAMQRTLRIAQAPSNDPLRDYSPMRALRWAAGMIPANDAGLEVYWHDERIRAGREPISPRSVFLPASVIRRLVVGERALAPYQTTVSGSGAELVEMTLRPDTFIDALRPRSVVLQLGARVISGLKGDIQIPRQATASSAYWLSPGGSPVESGAITESEGTFDSTPLQVAPCQLGGYGTISRLLMRQGGDLADEIIANDLTNVLATALDVAAIQGAGTSGTPTGVTATTGINAVSGTTFSYATSVTALTDLTTADAARNRRALGWAATPTVAGLLAQRVKVTGFPAYIWDGNADTGSINGHIALASNNVPSGTAVFGDWSQLLVLEWGDPDAAIEIEVSTFGAGFSAGDLQIRAMTSANIAVRHPPSFSVVSSIT